MPCDLELDDPLKGSLHKLKGLTLGGPAQFNASCGCRMSSSDRISHAKCAPAHTAMFFWKSDTCPPEAACTTSCTAFQTVKVFDPWGTPKVHHGQSASEHLCDAMGREPAPGRRAR